MSRRFLNILVPVVMALVLSPMAANALPPEVLQSVVRIKPDWPQAARGLDASGAPRDPQGTGIAVLPGGYIATNVHVIGKAKKVDVLSEDGHPYAAEIIGLDLQTDIALLKIAADLPVLKTATNPQLADPVCAIGNQFGLGLSVTCGVVSASGRSGMGFNPVEDFIQTDAAVNPGGSGGALVDRQGYLLGMVSAIFTKQSDADIGINFATSVPLLMRVVEDLKSSGRVVRGVAGFKAQALPPQQAASTVGVMIETVDIRGPAFAAGLEAGDILHSINDRRLQSLPALEAMMFMFRPGDVITLQTKRGAEPRTLTLTLGGG
ncbi:MAG: trypsin-like peptidase domain-containing protein [Rhodospirillales bacterium]